MNNVLSLLKIQYKDTILTERQIEILSLIGEGYGNQEISRTLWLSTRTIENHIANIRKIFDVNGQRISDRMLTVKAKEMLDGCKAYIRERKNGIMFVFKNTDGVKTNVIDLNNYAYQKVA